MKDVDADLAALVAADPGHAGPPDLVALRDGGRRLVRRRRLTSSVVAAATVLAIGVPGALLLTASGDRAGDDPSRLATDAASPTASASPTGRPTENPSGPPATPQRRGEAPLPGGGSLVGTWEAGTVLGDTVEIGVEDGYSRVLYAAESVDDETVSTCVSLGVRVGDRILRLLCAVTPLTPGDKDLWGGGRYEEGAGPDLVGPQYLVVGAAPGDITASIAAPGLGSRPVTGRSTAILPGHTVYYDQAAWDDGWDPLQLAPLTITTSTGETLRVPERSYES